MASNEEFLDDLSDDSETNEEGKLQFQRKKINRHKFLNK